MDANKRDCLWNGDLGIRDFKSGSMVVVVAVGGSRINVR